MSFVPEFNAMNLSRLVEQSLDTSSSSAEQAVRGPATGLSDFVRLISPAAGSYLENLGQRSQAVTRQRFGNVIRLFAPLYVSNECINICTYCGFSRDNAILRVTLSPDEVAREARALSEQGFRNILLVAGEHPKFVSTRYLAECVQAVRGLVPGVSLEVGPLSTSEYEALVTAGAEGLVVYQETYDRETYAEMHTAGPKKNFDYRLETPERAYAAGFRRLGIGALYGLSNWRLEAISVAAHAQYLLRTCWKAQVTISLPRLRPCAGEFEPKTPISDRELVQLVCAFRIFLPDAGLVLSTREPQRLRDGLLPLGITMMSAGSHTEPGGYTGAGKENIHRTERGRRLENVSGASEWAGATKQFEIADERSPEEVATRIRDLGYEPVWKDWEAVLSSP